MPQSNSWRDLIRLVLFTFAAWALWALGRNDAKPGAVDETETTETTRKRSGFSKRRLATSIAFTTIFFAGAAFTAGATGDTVAKHLQADGEPCAVDDCPGAAGLVSTSTENSEPAEPPTSGGAVADKPVVDEPVVDNPGTEDTSAGGGAAGGSDDGQSADQPADQGDPAEQPSDGGAAPVPGAGGGQNGGGNASGGDNGSGGGGQLAEEEPDSPAAGPGSPNHAGDDQSQSQAADSPVDVDAAHDAAVDAENASSFGTFWLHRTLPDPTPPARRLEPRFARNLASVSRSQHVDWALVLGVVRAQGHRGSVPATKAKLRSLASHLRRLNASQNAWQAVLALEGRTSFADRTIALRNYNRAVGLRTLVRGLVASKAALRDRVLSDRRIDIYAGGRSDIAAGREDVRILALLRYLAEAHGQVTVSCLLTGHGLYARPGVVSAHIYGEAVDISALGGVSIYGNQQPGGVTEKAVRNILLLPVELRPKQVISLLGMGGPSFALADHYDHIHVGY
jgi:hypothetical protein